MCLQISEPGCTSPTRVEPSCAPSAPGVGSSPSTQLLLPWPGLPGQWLSQADDKSMQEAVHTGSQFRNQESSSSLENEEVYPHWLGNQEWRPNPRQAPPPTSVSQTHVINCTSRSGFPLLFHLWILSPWKTLILSKEKKYCVFTSNHLPFLRFMILLIFDL